MNSASNTRRISAYGKAILALAFMLGAVPALAQQAAPAYSDAPTPIVDNSAASASDRPEDFVGEGDTGADAMKIEDVVRLLQEGNSRPLTIAELARINDAMKRMDYLAQVQRRMSEAQGGAPVSTSSVSAMAAPGMASGAVMGNSFSVLRISGSAGNYSALISNGQQQMIVKEGDMVGTGKVTSINLSGVRVFSDGSVNQLPFSSPVGVYGSSRVR